MLALRNAIEIGVIAANFGSLMIFASDCFTIEPNELLNIKYLFRVLKYNQQNIYQLATGAAQPHVYAKDFSNFFCRSNYIRCANSCGYLLQVCHQWAKRFCLEYTYQRSHAYENGGHGPLAHNCICSRVNRCHN